MCPNQEQSTGLGAPPAGPGLAWTDPSGATRTRLDVVAGVCVVRIEGALGAAALQPCRAALDAASALHPENVIVDLAGTQAPQPATLPLLAAARRYLQHRGVVMTLTAVSPELLQELREARVAGRYDLQPTTAVAVAKVWAAVTARRLALSGPAQAPAVALHGAARAPTA